MVYGDVGRRADEHLALVDAVEVVDDGGAGGGLAGARRALDEGQSLHEDGADGLGLVRVERGEAGDAEIVRDATLDAFIGVGDTEEL
jgi:hypothetical protein